MPEFGRRMLATAIGLLLSLLTVNAVSADGIQHTVSAGDTLSGISDSYGVSVEIIVEINHIADRNLIIVGDVLNISGQERSSGEASYIIQPGDTLSQIAVRFDVTLDDLMAVNGLGSDLIIAGRSLLIPGGAGPQPAPEEPAPPPMGPIEIPGQRPQDAQIEATIEELSTAEGVDPGLVKSIAWIESGWDQGARSPAGAVGVMQLTPGTMAWLEGGIFHQELNEDVSVYDNIKAGVFLLGLLQRETGSTELAVAAYYQGLGITRQGTIYNETRRYMDGVFAMKARFWP